MVLVTTWIWMVILTTMMKQAKEGRRRGHVLADVHQSLIGRFDVIRVDRFSQRRMITSTKNTPERLGYCFMPMSSMIRRVRIQELRVATRCPGGIGA